MKTTCIIQARMGSARLPGKVLQPILHQPMLWWVVQRIRRCRLIDTVVVATTTESQDDRIASLCQQEGWPCYRGNHTDVLDRYYQAAREFSAKHIVRITADCPLIDPAVSEYTIAMYHSAAPAIDYANNLDDYTYPKGLDTEIFSFTALERAWYEAQSPTWREHVTLYIRQHPDRFRLLHATNPINFSHYRWTVDTHKDMEFVRRIYDHFGDGDFGWRDILDVLTQFPDWAEMNRDDEQNVKDKNLDPLL